MTIGVAALLKQEWLPRMSALGWGGASGVLGRPAR